MQSRVGLAVQLLCIHHGLGGFRCGDDLTDRVIVPRLVDETRGRNSDGVVTVVVVSRGAK